jgi:hypothetical protein
MHYSTNSNREVPANTLVPVNDHYHRLPTAVDSERSQLKGPNRIITVEVSHLVSIEYLDNTYLTLARKVTKSIGLVALKNIVQSLTANKVSLKKAVKKLNR